MWPDILDNLPDYESAVLSWLDEAGRVGSARCHPAPDVPGDRLRLALPDDLALAPGPACLLWHRHDENLWNLHSFAVRGVLGKDEVGWFVRPEQFVPGVGVGGWRSYARFLVDGRRTAARYLAKRGLPRPRIDWPGLMAMLTGTEP